MIVAFQNYYFLSDLGSAVTCVDILYDEISPPTHNSALDDVS